MVNGTTEAAQQIKAMLPVSELGLGQAAQRTVPSHTSAAHNPLIPTIFHEDWWLDASTGGAFHVAEVMSGGRIVGRLPFIKTKYFGFKTIRMPVLTYFLGPAIDEGEGTPVTRYLTRLNITRDLIEKLPRVSWECIRCHGGVTDVVAFQELGFRTHVQFTYQIAPMSEEMLWRQLRNKTRNVIRKAEQQFTVTEIGDAEEFVRLYEDNLKVKGLSNVLNGKPYKETIAAALSRERGRILVARDTSKKIVASNLCVWDSTASYYLLSTRSDEAGNGASSLLLWAAIRDAARRRIVFDFAGLGCRGSVLLYSGFGGETASRYIAIRAQLIPRIVNEIRCSVTPESYFY